jgi:hypothetical protein
MITQAGLQPLLFAHPGALEDPAEEIMRLRMLEKDKQSPGNFVVYLGKKNATTTAASDDGYISLNPCLASAVSHFTCGTVRIPPRIGSDNPALNGRNRAFLRRFVAPIRRCDLTGEDVALVAVYKRLLFLMEHR